MSYGLTHAEVVEWIHARRRERGLSLAKVATLAGIELRTLQRYITLPRLLPKLGDVVQALGAKMVVEFDIVEHETHDNCTEMC